MLTTKTRQRQNATRRDKTRQDKTRQDATRRDTTRHDKTRRDDRPHGNNGAGIRITRLFWRLFASVEGRESKRQRRESKRRNARPTHHRERSARGDGARGAKRQGATAPRGGEQAGEGDGARGRQSAAGGDSAKRRRSSRGARFLGRHMPKIIRLQLLRVSVVATPKSRLLPAGALGRNLASQFRRFILLILFSLPAFLCVSVTRIA
jgi:hypothetical protein